MAKFITTLKFTDKGVAAIRDTANRGKVATEALQAMGVTASSIYWTMGQFDGLLVFDAPDDETATAAMYYISSLGNVQTQTMRAFDATEIESILAKLP